MVEFKLANNRLYVHVISRPTGVNSETEFRNLRQPQRWHRATRLKSLPSLSQPTRNFIPIIQIKPAEARLQGALFERLSEKTEHRPSHCEGNHDSRAAEKIAHPNKSVSSERYIGWREYA
jgi:hypothetical protein